MKHLRVAALSIAAMGALPVHADQASPATAQVVPTVYEAGHFFAVPETRDGQRLKLLVDTGGGGNGGMYWVTKTVADRLHLAPVDCRIGDHHVQAAPLPDYRPQRGLPPPLDGPCGAALLVLPLNDKSMEGLLGGTYLTGRIWTFDYPAQRLALEPSSWRPAPGARATKLGFQHDEAGKHTTGFARITIVVDGEPLDMLLDTGATAFPTPAAAKLSGTPTVGGQGVASYITTGKLDAWHRQHPDWRVLEHADTLVTKKAAQRIIEVPQVEIAGWSIGPVWFTERPDKNFHEYMAQMMDKPTEGAVGGNVFKHFAMTIDYPRETAYFRCIEACAPAAGK